MTGQESGHGRAAIPARRVKHGVWVVFNPNSRKRPFYRVSSDVFDHSIKLLRRFVSEEELPDLTVENIQRVLANVEMRSNKPPVTQTPSTEVERNGVDDTQPAAGEIQEVVERDEHPLLQEDLGSMILDSLGKYRYVGAESSIRWNHAARMACASSSIHLDPKVVSPLKTGLLPPLTPESTSTARTTAEISFPCRQLCMHYVTRFFEHIHCLYWFYSPEQFYPLLEATLNDGGTTATASWLCSLYSIFALGSMRSGKYAAGPGMVTPPQDCKQTADYLAMAKDQSSAAADEADLETIKAFGLLGLAMHGSCYSMAAYLNVGAAVKIAFSLGLHRDMCSRTKDLIERERCRRLWWTIYTLDHEISIRLGYPCAIVDEAIFMNIPPASEQVLDPGPNMPLGYQALFVSLVKLRKKISYDCFLEPAQAGGRLPISRVFNSLARQRRWLEGVPSYLHWKSSLPPQHRRAVAVLHLRYWISVIFITRPFLLFLVAKPSQITVLAKRKCYEELSARCIQAAERAVEVLKHMKEADVLSSMTLFDCHSIGEVMWILILAFQKLGSAEHQQIIRFCLETLKSMDQVGWCGKVLPDLEARVQESGTLDNPAPNLTYSDQTLATEQMPPQNDPGASRVDTSLMMQTSPPPPPSQALEQSLDFFDFDFSGSQFSAYEMFDLDCHSDLLGVFDDTTSTAPISMFGMLPV
ncbi:uncharacterized protein A1O5_04081 [Cladophialophora psammophila CBS 110553]|uniref:Xylanolytic transcriptional activator regulatory domain-containing protein n=1 Tax=Cladophialophora psammophila CBS 110553 TaxID=1182543 RepID=W9WXK5_9EURO|nr:uncharacterized protein A1O5_04081 [Cladophialophora psammophila CBS 110553]EXJ72932.1 hypothetical protein A1O5_04081 [Cladophialophora psammophila CBS 110553]